MNAVRHFERLFIDRCRPFYQQDTNAAGIQERDAFVRQSREILAADNLGVELRASFYIAYRNAEVGNTP